MYVYTIYMYIFMYKDPNLVLSEAEVASSGSTDTANFAKKVKTAGKCSS